MRKRILLYLTALLTLSITNASYAQSYISESFDGTTFPPTGWTVSGSTGLSDGGGCGCTDWVRATSGGLVNPTPSTHSGAGMAAYNSWDIYYGSSNLITPSFNMSTYSSGTDSVTFWYYKYSYYTDDYINVYINSSASTSGATLLATLYDGIYYSPTTSSTGWYRFAYALPSSFRSSSTTYVIFQANSDYYYDQYLDDVNIIHKPAPTITGSSTYCDGDTISLTASISLSSPTFYWTGPGGFTSTDSSISIANATSSNSGTYSVIAVSGTDTSLPNTITISDQTPTVTAISSNSPICSGSNLTFSLTHASVTGPTYSWSGPNGFSSTTQNPTITSAITAAGGMYHVTISSTAGCSYSDSVSATVDSTPNITSASGTNPTTCTSNDGKITLTGLMNNTIYTVNYTKNGTSVTAFYDTSNASGNVIISGLDAAIYNNITLSSSSGCTSAAVGPITLSNPTTPATPTIASGSPVCNGAILNMSANSATSPVYYYWSGPGGFSATTSAFTINPVGFSDSGTYYVYVKDTSGCTSTIVSTDVVVKPLPANPTASSNSPVCQGSTLNLSGNCSTSGVTYSWSGPNSFSATTQNPSISNVQLNAIGTYSVYSYLNGCRSASAGTTNVYVKWTPGTPTANSNSPVCSGMGYNTNTLILSSSDTSAGVTFTWSGPNGFSVSNSSSATQLRTNPPLADSGTYTVYATLNGCNSASTTTNVKIKPTPSSPIVSPSYITYCQYDTVSALTATGDSLRWHLSSTGTSDSGTFIAPIPNDSVPGIYYWYVTQTRNGCESQPTTNTVNVKARPALPYLGMDSSFVYCQGDNPARLNATGVNLLWYTTATGGTGDPVAPLPSTASSGDFYYYVTQTVNGCESFRARVHILVKTKPAPPSVSVVTYCQGDVAIPLSAGGANLLWYTTSSGGIGSPVAPTPLTSYADTIHYYVTQTVNGCQSDRAELLVVVNYTPNAVIVASQPYVCQFDTMSFKYYGNGKTDATYNWTMPTGASIVGGIGQGPIVVRFDSFGHRNVLLLVDNKGCRSPLTSYTVDVRQAPYVPLVSKSDICQGQTLDMSLGYPNEPIDDYKWDFDNGNIVYGSNGSGPYGIEWDIAGPKYVKLVVYANACHSRDIIDTVQVHPLGDATIQSVSSNNICAGDTVVFTAERYNPAYLYQWMPATYFTNSTNQGQVKGLIGQSGYIKLQVTTEYGCVSMDSTLIAAQPCCEMYFPNAFTPNGDGKNDIFRPITRGNQQLKTFRVINRWGQVMFETTDQHMGWDGKFNGVPQDLGTYYYYAEYTCANGRVYKEKGELILLR